MTAIPCVGSYPDTACSGLRYTYTTRARMSPYGGDSMMSESVREGDRGPRMDFELSIEMPWSTDRTVYSL